MAPQQSEWSTLKSANLTELEPTNAVHQPRLLKSGESSATRFRNQLGLNPPSSVRVWPSEPSRSWSCACRGRHGPGRRTIYQLPGPGTSRLYSSAIALAIPLGMDIDIVASSFWDGVSLNPTQNLYSF